MARRMENHAGRMAVPQFGGWDQKSAAAGGGGDGAGNPNYSVVFSAARANRKQNKTEVRRGGSDPDLINPFHDQQPVQPPPALSEERNNAVTKQPDVVVVVNHFQPPPLQEECTTNPAGWKAVPQFGGWDQKSAATGGAGNPNYSVVFSAARANRKQHKTDVKRGASIGSDQELINPFHQQPAVSHFKPPPLLEECHMKKKKFFRYFSCCSV